MFAIAEVVGSSPPKVTHLMYDVWGELQLVPPPPDLAVA
jgi:hypothetical protein